MWVWCVVLGAGPSLEGPDRSSRRACARTLPASFAAAYGTEEVIVVTITHDHEDRGRSYELLAAEFGLAPTGG